MHRWMSLVGRVVLILGIVPSLPADTQALEKPTVTATMPFELISDFLVVVKGRIADMDGLRFVVDTGTTHTVINRKVADRLQLHRRAGKVMNFDRDISVEWAEIPNIQLGSLRFAAIRVMVMNLAEYSELADNVDGIIGLDLLSKSKKLTIDYETTTLSFQLQDDGAADKGFSGCFTIPFVVQGITMSLVVDTGHQDVLLYRDRARKRLPMMRTRGESKRVTLGRLQATRVNLTGVQIGGPDEVTTVFLIDGPGDGALPGIDGYLGPSSLHAKRIQFDFAAKVLRWQ